MEHTLEIKHSWRTPAHVWAGATKNCFWNGKYTHGQVYEKGTQIGFNRPVGVFDFGGFYSPDEENYGLIRGDLESVISDLEEKKAPLNRDLAYCKKDLNSLIEMFEELTQWEGTVKEHLETMANKEYEVVLVDRWPTRTIWFLNDKPGIIRELKEVFGVCKAEGSIELD